MTSIAESVQELVGVLLWTEETTVLGEPEYDTSGWLEWGPVRVTWTWDGDEEWVAVNVTCDGAPVDINGYPRLGDAVVDAVHRSGAWRGHVLNELREVAEDWMISQGWADLDTTIGTDESWALSWVDVVVRGEIGPEGEAQWTVSGPDESLAGEGVEDLLFALETCFLGDEEQEQEQEQEQEWTSAVAVLTADMSGPVQTSADQQLMYSRATVPMRRRARFEPGRVMLEHRMTPGDRWRLDDEWLTEDQDVSELAREAYEWVRGEEEW